MSTVSPARTRGARGMGSTYRVTIDGVQYWQASRSRTITDPVTGERKRQRITASALTKSAAIAKLHAKLGSEPTPRKPKTVKPALTYGEWFHTWLAEIPEWKCSDVVRHKYKRMGEMYLLPRLGDRDITSIDTEDIHSLIWRDLMDNAALSEASIRNIYRVCFMSFRAAVDTKRVPITVNPVKTVPTPSKKDYVPSLSKEIGVAKGLVKWMRDTSHPDEARFLFQFLALRRNERLGLGWSNVHNLDNASRAKIVVSQQIARYQDGSGWYLKPPKTENGVREIPLVEPFLTTLRQWKKTQAAQRAAVEAEGGVWGGEDGRFADLVFLTAEGNLIQPNKDNRDWHKLMHEYTGGKHDWRGHLNRHLTATLLAESGVSVAVARTVLGHSTDAMTYFYTHVSNEAKRPALDSYAATLTERIKQ